MIELSSILQHVEYKLALRGVHHKLLLGHLAVALGVDRFPERRKPCDGRKRGEYAIHCYIKCPFLGLGACFGQFSSNDISFHHELMFANGLEF